MRKSIILLILGTVFVPIFSYAAIAGIQNGGTASSSLSGILVGNLLGPVQSLKIGAGCTFLSNTLSCVGTGGGSFPFTSTSYGVSTSTTLGLTNGFISTASSTVTGALTAATSSVGILNGVITVTGWPYAQNTTGINQALSECGVNGIGAVYLPAGSYSITAPPNVPSNCEFYGAGQGRTIFTDGSGSVLSQFFNVTTKNNVSMHGFSIIGNGSLPPTGIGPADGIDDTGSTNVSLHDISFSMINNAAIFVGNSGTAAASSTDVYNITADCTVGAPIQASNDTTATPVVSLWLHNNNVCGNDSGLAIFNSIATKVWANYINKTGTIAGQGLEIGSNSASSAVSDMEVWGNTIVGAFQSDISIAGGATTTGFANDNDLSNAGTAGLTFAAVSTGFTLSDNKEHGNKQDGLEALAGNSRIISKLIITNNVAYDNGQSGAGYCGIELNTQSSGSIIGAQITGGALTDDQSSHTQTYGLCVNNTTSQQNSSGDTIMNIAFSGNASTSMNFVNAGTMYAIWANQGATTTYTPNLFVASPDGSASAPAYGFASNSGTGLYAINGNILAFTEAGTNNLQLDNSELYAGNGNGFLFSTGNADSGSSPTIRPDRSSSNTGFAAGTAGQLNAIVGGNEITRWNSLGFGVLNNAPKYPLDVTGAGHFTGLVDADHFVATSTSATSTLPIVSIGAPVGASVGTAKVLGNALIIPSFSGFGALDLQSNGLIADTVDLLHIEQVNGTDSGNAVTIHGNVNGASQNSLFVDNGGHSALPSGDSIVQFTNGNATDKQGGIIFKLQATGNQASGIVTLATNNGLAGFGTTSPMAALAIAPASSTLPQVVSWPTGSSTPSFIVSSTNAGGYVGIGTSTPGSLFSIANLANFTTATSTFYSTGGINIAAGCFSINGTCVGGSGGGGTVTAVTATAPLFSSGGTAPNITWAGLSTTTNLLSSNLLVSNGGAGVYAVSTSSVAVNAPITYSGTLGAFVGGVGGNFGCTTAASGVTGCLGGSDWTSFNNKVSSTSLSATAPLGYTPSTGVFTCTSCLTANQTITLTGAVSGSGATSIATTFNYTPWGGSVGTTFNTSAVASTTPLWAQGGIFASSTSATPTLAVTQSGTGAAAIFTGGNVGIATTSPYTLLDIQSSKTGDDTPAFVIDGSATANGNADLALTRATGGTGEANIDFNNGGTNVWQLGIQNTGADTGDFELWDGLNNPIFTIQRGSNNASFGTTTPAANDLVTFSTSTEPQFSLCDNSANLCGDFRNVGNSFFFSTSSPFASNGATSSVNLLSFNEITGALTLPENATTTAAGGFNISSGCFSINSTCIGGGGAAGASGLATTSLLVLSPIVLNTTTASLTFSCPTCSIATGATSTAPSMFTYAVATSTTLSSFFPLASSTAFTVNTNFYVGRNQGPSNNTSAYFVNASNGVGAATFDSNGSAGISTDLVDIKQINGSDTGVALKVTGNIGATQNALLVQNGGSQALPLGGVEALIQNTNSTDKQGGILLKLSAGGNQSSGIDTLVTTGGLVGLGTSTPWGFLSMTPASSTLPQIVSWPTGSSTPSFIVSSTNAGGYVGIGTTSPAALFSVSAASSSLQFSPIEMISSIINGITFMFQTIDEWGHLMTGGSVPTCGTGCSSVTGDDRTMEVITGSSVSSVTVNFSHAWSKHPICEPTDESGVTTGVEASTTVSTIILSLPTALTSKNIGIICQSSAGFTY